MKVLNVDQKTCDLSKKHNFDVESDTCLSSEDDWSASDVDDEDSFSDDSLDDDDWSVSDASDASFEEDLESDLSMFLTNATMTRNSSVLSLSAIKAMKAKSSGPNTCMTRSLSTPPEFGRGIVTVAQTVSAHEDETTVEKEGEHASVKPSEYLTKYLESQGLDASPVKSETLEGFFVEMSAENTDAYQFDLVNAFREMNLNDIKGFHREGQMLQCCNKFGESVVHLTCRRGSYEVLKYLTSEGNVSVNVKCDSGRTPMHDACWTSKPNFDLVKLLLTLSPDLLHISDNRGFSPLSYVPKTLWGEWCSFLEENHSLLSPRLLQIKRDD